MDAASLIADARAAGFQLKVARGSVYIRPAAKVPPALRASLSEHRCEIIEQLASEGIEQEKNETIWVCRDEADLMHPEVVASGHTAVLVEEIEALGSPTHIRELLMAKRVFGPSSRVVSRQEPGDDLDWRGG
jgi:hypothetical protein